MKHLFDLPEDQSQELHRLAKTTGLPMSFFVREALRKILIGQSAIEHLPISGRMLTLKACNKEA